MWPTRELGLAKATTGTKEKPMAKGKDTQKSNKKKPEKTLKEKRKEKKAKKGKGPPLIK